MVFNANIVCIVWYYYIMTIILRMMINNLIGNPDNADPMLNRYTPLASVMPTKSAVL